MNSLLFVCATREEAAYLPSHVPKIITGVGTMACGISLTRFLSSANQPPSRLLNIGTAGALKNGMSGVFEIDHVHKHDFSSELISRMTAKPCANGLELDLVTKLPTARLATGDSFISDSQARNRLAKHSDLVDMEGAVVAWVGAEFGIPVTLLKQVSDQADEKASATWFDAVDQGAKELVDALSTSGLLFDSKL